MNALAGQVLRAVGCDRAGRSAGTCRRACYLVAAIAPDLPVDRLSILARYAAWSVELDDRLDGRGVSAAAVAGLERQLAAILAGQCRPGPGDDPLLTELVDVVDALHRWDGPGLRTARFGGALLDAVATAAEHAQLARAVASGERAPPTAGEYLAVAARTSNYLSFAYALVAAGSERSADPHRPGTRAPDAWAPDTWAGDDDMRRFDRAVGHGAAAVRLANDLRSVARDEEELTLNIVHLHTAAGAPMTRRRVRAELARRVRLHDRELALLTGSQSPAGRLIRCLRLAVGMYLRTDLRA